eukprot:3017593-Amphidinium_carterae.1
MGFSVNSLQALVYAGADVDQLDDNDKTPMQCIPEEVRSDRSQAGDQKPVGNQRNQQRFDLHPDGTGAHAHHFWLEPILLILKQLHPTTATLPQFIALGL